MSRFILGLLIVAIVILLFALVNGIAAWFGPAPWASPGPFSP